MVILIIQTGTLVHNEEILTASPRRYVTSPFDACYGGAAGQSEHARVEETYRRLPTGLTSPLDSLCSGAARTFISATRLGSSHGFRDARSDHPAGLGRTGIAPS